MKTAGFSSIDTQGAGPADGLFIPSGARVPLLKLPPIDRPIRLDDRRALRLREMGEQHTHDGLPIPWQMWDGPDGLQMMASLDPTDAWGPLLHLSVSFRNVRRYPTWDDLTAIKAAVFGDVDAAMVMPMREDYVNIRENCFQLWQIPQRWGIR